MNDLAKILDIYGIKVKLQSINDQQIIIRFQLRFHFIFALLQSLIYAHIVTYSLLKYIDYRIQKIKDIPFHDKLCTLFLNKRRYPCSRCGKHFYKSYDFIAKYLHRTKN